MHSSPEHVYQALRAGASGYVLKESAGGEVVSAVRAVHAGRRYLSEKISPRTIDDYIRERGPDHPLEKLSRRELQVLKLIVQPTIVNGNPNPKAIFGDWAMDLPVIAPIAVGVACGLFAGLVNGLLIAYTKIPPFIATLGMMVSARGVARWWSNGNPISFPTEGYAHLSNGDVVGTLTFGLVHWQGQNPAIVFIVLAILFHLIMRYTLYGKRSYAIGSNEAAARMSGINVARHKLLVYTIAGMLAAVAAILLTSQNLTAQAGMGVMYELDAIAMAVIGGVSLSGGRGSIVGTVIGALIFSVIISGFTSIRLDAYYQDMVKGAIIVGAVVLDQWRQRRAASGT